MGARDVIKYFSESDEARVQGKDRGQGMIQQECIMFKVAFDLIIPSWLDAMQ